MLHFQKMYGYGNDNQYCCVKPYDKRIFNF